jgi:hypothetical protein
MWTLVTEVLLMALFGSDANRKMPERKWPRRFGRNRVFDEEMKK